MTAAAADRSNLRFRTWPLLHYPNAHTLKADLPFATVRGGKKRSLGPTTQKEERDREKGKQIGPGGALISVLSISMGDNVAGMRVCIECMHGLVVITEVVAGWLARIELE